MALKVQWSERIPVGPIAVAAMHSFEAVSSAVKKKRRVFPTPEASAAQILDGEPAGEFVAAQDVAETATPGGENKKRLQQQAAAVKDSLGDQSANVVSVMTAATVSSAGHAISITGLFAELGTLALDKFSLVEMVARVGLWGDVSP